MVFIRLVKEYLMSTFINICATFIEGRAYQPSSSLALILGSYHCVCFAFHLPKVNYIWLFKLLLVLVEPFPKGLPSKSHITSHSIKGMLFLISVIRTFSFMLHMKTEHAPKAALPSKVWFLLMEGSLLIFNKCQGLFFFSFFFIRTL